MADIPVEQWRGVDEGWGRRAAEFAALSEPGNCREYVAMHQHLDVGAGVRLLDVACGSGLAIELAVARGASCAGLDASHRLVAVAQDRNPASDVRTGDMHALPWEDDTFDVVTSFRGIWGTTPDAVAEVRRVLRPGGRMGLTVWGHIKASSGAWALKPFTLAADEKVANQAAMVSLGRPGVGEDLLSRWGFDDVQCIEIPFAWEFPDPETYARALAATGPAYEAIQSVGEEAFTQYAVDVAREHVRDGLPLRAEIKVVGYVARKPATRTASLEVNFLPDPEPSPAVDEFYAGDLEELGYVMNSSRLWGRHPQSWKSLFGLIGTATELGGLSFRQRAILVTATAATISDSYCSMAWGAKFAKKSGPDIAAGVLRGSDGGLTPQESALAAWARQVARDPNATTADDVNSLRNAGFDDMQIFAITVYVAARIALSTVNDALGSAPDVELAASLHPEVREAVAFGRPPGE
ncbi:MAG: methyltransferase domain-containing protein [Aeromicrobium sp.]|uniref:methyltransferase domain-containing protein n=1 Tax=Aeromicrobium sp. TaxID=1871063 RepID=UPI003C63F2E8